MNGINPSDPDYAKKKQDWKSLESLAKTIVDDQLINPIFVYRYGNKCRLIAGERRTLASAIAGKKEIIARIASQRPVGTKLKSICNGLRIMNVLTYLLLKELQVLKRLLKNI